MLVVLNRRKRVHLQLTRMIPAHHQLRLRLRRSARRRRQTAKAAQMVLEASAAAAARMKSKTHKALEDSDNLIVLQ